VWGEKSLPQTGDQVIVMFLEGRVEKKVIIGTFLPFLYSLFASQQVAVSSTGKTNSTKLLKDEDSKTVRRVYPSGVTEEYDDAGNFILETPAGKAVTIKAGGNVTIQGGTFVTLKSGDAITWLPNILPIDPLTGLPHGGPTAGIVKLKGA